jgi:hypothetical protein
LLTGAGRFPELVYVPRKVQAEEEEGEARGPSDEWETLIPYPSPVADQDSGIFRPGEIMSDYKAVVEAIGSGRRAANSIHKHLSGDTVTAPAQMIRKHTHVLSLDRLEPVAEAPRQKMPERSKEEQISHPTAEIALGYEPDQAVQEAKRCLQCGLICYRRVRGTLH